MSFIWQNPDWPLFKIKMQAIQPAYEKYLYQKGLTDQVFSLISPETRKVVYAQTITDDVVASNEIEGISISYDSVYSSVARALNIDNVLSKKQDKYSQILAQLALSIQEKEKVITEETILNWHKSLFDGASPANRPNTIGGYRNGPVYVMSISGSMKQEVLYEAVPAKEIQKNMLALIKWISDSADNFPLIVKSAIASMWFVSIHPFEDGNGRISRLLADAIMVQKDSNLKFYSVSSAILKNKKEYYKQLYDIQHSESMDATQFVSWYINLVSDSLSVAENTCKKKLSLSKFMASLDPSDFNSREISMLYRLASGNFYGKLTADKWSKLAKCQSATATRDLAHLVEKGLLIKSEEGGRASWYYLNDSVIDL
jgi:Fic family protein